MPAVTAVFVGLGLVLAAATLVWILSVRLRDASIADVWWGLSFPVLTWVYLYLSPASTSRGRLMAVLITAWGVRLSVHIFGRSRGRGEDARYAAMRAAHGEAFWWRSLLTVFWLQAAIAWFVALPLFVAIRAPQPASVTVVDVLGVVVFAIGFAFEAIGDHQLRRFRANPGNRGRVLDTGLWRYTRHPNYFGDATLWWGIYVIALSVPTGWATVLSPSLMTLLLWRVSGVTLLEAGLTQSKPGYRDYIVRTPAFFPRFRDGGR